MERDELGDVLERLETLSPGAGEAPRPAGQMLARIKSELETRQPVPLGRRLQEMFSRKYAVAALAVLVLAVALALPPVRAAASDFLGLFRVQKFAAISVSPRQMAQLERIAEEGLVPGELEMVTEPGPAREVTSLTEASLMMNRRVRSPEALGTPERVLFTEGGQGRLTINLRTARAILRAAEVDPELLPDSLDGAVVDVTVYPSVQQEWGDVVLLQSESPLIDYPDDVDVTVLGEALLQLLGMTPSEAQRLAQSIDWTSTLLLPIPTELGSFSEIQVDGTTGIALSSWEGTSSSLMWSREGTVFALVSEGRTTAELREIVESMK